MHICICHQSSLTVYIVYVYVDCMVEMLATWHQNAPSYATSRPRILNKNSGEEHSPPPHTSSAPTVLRSSCLQHLPSPRSKILNPPLASATVLAAAPTSAPSLGRRLEAAPATVTSATAAAVAWAGSLESRSHQTGSKKYGLNRR